jgi:hypothetical protein
MAAAIKKYAVAALAISGALAGSSKILFSRRDGLELGIKLFVKWISFMV